MNFENMPVPEKLGIRQMNKSKKISRRSFLKLLAAGAGVLALSACGVKPSEESTILQVEKEQNPELTRLLNGFDSVYHVFSTSGIPERLYSEKNIEPRIYEDDKVMRINLRRRLSELPANKTGKDLIIQSLGYPHIVHNNTHLLAEGFDIYNNFNPNQTERNSEARVLEVMKHDIEEVEKAKALLQAKGIEGLRGFALNYDGHSTDYLSSDAVDETFPTIETLRQHKVTRLIFVGEFSPAFEEDIVEEVFDGTYASENRLINFIQSCQRNGIEIIVWGIETRLARHEFNKAGVTGMPTELSCDVDYVELENGSTVVFGGCAPTSDPNPRVKLPDGTLMRVLGGTVQVVPPDNPLGRDATQEETANYYQLVNEASSQE